MLFQFDPKRINCPHLMTTYMYKIIIKYMTRVESDLSKTNGNRPFSHCLCACVYRSRGALFLDNRRDFTEMGQTDFKPLILSM